MSIPFRAATGSFTLSAMHVVPCARTCWSRRCGPPPPPGHVGAERVSSVPGGRSRRGGPGTAARHELPDIPIHGGGAHSRTGTSPSAIWGLSTPTQLEDIRQSVAVVEDPLHGFAVVKVEYAEPVGVLPGERRDPARAGRRVGGVPQAPLRRAPRAAGSV